MTKHVLLLALDFPPANGGIARLLEAWATDTDGVHWRVVTVTPGPASEIIRRTSLAGMAAAAFGDHRSWLRQSEERFVVAGHAYLCGLAVAVAKASGARSACVTYGRELTPRRLPLRMALLPLAATDCVVAISTYTRRLAVRAAARSARTRIVRPRLPPPWLASDVPTRLPDRGLRLVALTRLSQGYKNLELLIRLAAVLHPVRVVEKLTIIGGGPRLGPLRQKVAAIGASDVVELPGHLPDADVAAILSQSHVGLFASRNSMAERGFEGFGLVVHELAAAGLPVIVGGVAGATDSADHPWALQLDPDDLWAWVDATERLFTDEARRYATGCAALAWAAKIGERDSARQFASAILGDT